MIYGIIILSPKTRLLKNLVSHFFLSNLMEASFKKTPIVNNYLQEPIHDIEESRLVVAVYHQRKWMSPKGLVNATYHSMKFLHESKQYQLNPVEIELGRIPRIIHSKREKFADNPIVTIICYENMNKGRTLKGVENEEVFKAVVRNRQIGDNYQIFVEDQYWKDFIFQILQQINNQL